MAPEHPPTTCIDVRRAHRTPHPRATDTSRSLRRLLVYGVLWLTFTLGGIFVAVYLATAVTGVVGTLLWVAGGLGVLAAGPVVARRTMMALVSRM